MSTYEETFWLISPGRGAPARWADKKHDELKSFGRFWYQEIRDFLNSKRTVFGEQSRFVRSVFVSTSSKANPNSRCPQGNFLILIPDEIQVVSW
jgi:hypothetical protein